MPNGVVRRKHVVTLRLSLNPGIVVKGPTQRLTSRAERRGTSKARRNPSPLAQRDAVHPPTSDAVLILVQPVAGLRPESGGPAGAEVSRPASPPVAPKAEDLGAGEVLYLLRFRFERYAFLLEMGCTALLVIEFGLELSDARSLRGDDHLTLVRHHFTFMGIFGYL